MIDIQNCRKTVNSLLSERSHAIKQYNDEKKLLEKAKVHFNKAELAQSHIQTIAQKTQQYAHDNIANVVSRCIKAVYGEESYNFRIEFQKKRGKTEAKIIFEKGGIEHDPLNSTGGGVVDIAAFALRLSCIMLSKPKLRRIIVADEPFRFLHGDVYQQRAAELLEKLSEEMGIQMIIVTGLEWLKIGKVIQL